MTAPACEFRATGRSQRGLPRWECRHCPNYQLAERPGLAACRRQPARGLGDTIHAVTQALRIPHCKGCDDRQTWLNRLFPYQQTDEHPRAAMHTALTAGITSYERPAHLRRCLDTLRALYPDLRVIVADTSATRPELPAGVDMLQLPHDAGLSAARNALVRACQTPYLLIAEDDFLFTPTAPLRPLLDVLEHDPTVDVAGGGVIEAKQYRPGAFDFERTAGRLIARPASQPLRTTPSGISYRPCHKVANFLVVRREAVAAHPWPEELKVGEHAPWFLLLQEAGIRVAHVPTVSIRHDKSGRSKPYREARGRAKQMQEAWFTARGLTFEQDNFYLPLDLDAAGRPNIVVLGVGHSGTTILVRMLCALGWSAEGLDEEFAEPPRIRELNATARRTGCLPSTARAALPRSMPWIVKDPRFVWTLHLWEPHLRSQRPPLLVWITRNIERTVASYLRRGRFDGDAQRATTEITGRQAAAAEQFARWPWAKIHVDYDQVQAAAALFDVARG